MKIPLQTFNADIRSLLDFLETTEQEGELFSLLLQNKNKLGAKVDSLISTIEKAQTDRKRYIYAVAIVSLYGLFECLVNSLIKGFIDRISGVVKSYEMMPERIKKNHVSMSLELVRAIEKERYRTITETEETVIANLHSCLSGASNFRINGSAFVLHRGNISLKKVTEFLSSIDIDNHYRRVTLTPDFLDFLGKKDPERNLPEVADQDLSAILKPIDELVERRNQVSHGVVNIDDIEATDLLKDRCHFVEAYGHALYHVLQQEILKYRIKHDDVQKLGNATNVYNDSIVCFKSAVCCVAKNDVVVASTSDESEPYRFGRVISLEINKVPLEEIRGTESTDFGMKVPFKAKKEFDYYILVDDSF